MNVSMLKSWEVNAKCKYFVAVLEQLLQVLSTPTAVKDSDSVESNLLFIIIYSSW